MNRIVIAVVGPGEASMARLQGLGRELLTHMRIVIEKMVADGVCEPGELLVGENSMMVHLQTAQFQGRPQSMGGMGTPKTNKGGRKKPTSSE
jgi:hypothetical protein